MFELTRRNLNRSLWLAGFMLWMLLTMGYIAGDLLFPGHGLEGLLLSFFLFGFLSVMGFYEGSNLLLRAAGAKPIKKKHAPELFNIVEEIAIASGLTPVPLVYIIKSEIPNAFATGRSPETAAIAVTERLLEICTRDELQGIVAHEMAHIKHRDILYMTLLSVMMASIGHIGSIFRPHLHTDRWTGRKRVIGGAPIRLVTSRLETALKTGGAGAVMMLAGVLLLFLGPLLAKILYFAGSRTREYLADASAAIFTRNPGVLADALEKISGKMSEGKWASLPGIPKALLIVGPALFSTHPPIEHRMAILRKLADEPTIGYRSYVQAYTDVLGTSPTFIPQQILDEKENPWDASITSNVSKKIKKGKVKKDFIEQHMPWVPGYRLKQKGEAPLLEDTFRSASCQCGASFKIPDHVSSILDLECPSCHQPVCSI